MKIYRIAQDMTMQQPQQQATPEEVAAVEEAYNKMSMAIASINRGLSILENTNVLKLFSRESVINAITSGDVAQLSTTDGQAAVDAMEEITQSAMVVAQAQQTLAQNQRALSGFGKTMGSITTDMTNAIQGGSYAGWTSALPAYQASLAGITGVVPD